MISEASQQTGKATAAEIKKHIMTMVPEIGEYLKEHLRGTTPRKRKAPNQAGVQPTVDDLEDFFETLLSDGSLVRRVGSKLPIFNKLVPLWMTYLSEKYDCPVDLKASKKVNDTLRQLCQRGADQLPEDHPACSLAKGKCFCLVGWELKTCEQEE
jgi:hypothetical protein